MNEHSFIINSNNKPYKRQRVGDGIHLLLAKDGDQTVSHSFVFDADKYNVDDAVIYMERLGTEYKKIQAARPLNGKVWSSGLHHVFVNDKPARVYVPESTIMETFDQMKTTLEKEGKIGIGIDHLSDSILADNEILAKMNLLDVGMVSSIVTDGSGIYIKESTITNDAIRSLHEQGELPAYSIVGGMNAKPCPTGRADYIVEHIDVNRIDLVGQGGCESCKVGVQPSDIILTAKLSNKEEIDMEIIASEAPVEEVTETEEVVEEPVEEVAEVETVEEAVEETPVEQEEAKEEDEVIVVDDEPSEIDELKKEIKDLKEMLGGKKPKMEAAKPSFDVESEITSLIKAGKATPAMKDMLVKVAEQSEDAFHAMAASMPKFVSMKMESKLAKIEEQTKKPKKPKTWEEEYGEMAALFRV